MLHYNYDMNRLDVYDEHEKLIAKSPYFRAYQEEPKE